MRTATQLTTPTTTTQPLSERQLRDFHRIGWLYLPRQFDADEVAAMRHCFERLERRAFELGRDAIDRGSRFVVESNRIHRVVWCGGAEPELAAFGADPRLTRPAAQLLGGRELRQLINQAHFKLPGDGFGPPSPDSPV